jgi:hypothetical protein
VDIGAYEFQDFPRLLAPALAGADVLVTWQSVAGLSYFVQRGTNLSSPVFFTTLASSASPLQPQRGCVAKPRVGAAPTLGGGEAMPINPKGVEARWPENRSPASPISRAGHNPFGVDCPSVAATQGCPFGPTLGFETQPRCG